MVAPVNDQLLDKVMSEPSAPYPPVTMLKEGMTQVLMIDVSISKALSHIRVGCKWSVNMVSNRV